MGTESYEERRRERERLEEFERQLEEEEEKREREREIKLQIARRNMDAAVRNNKIRNRQLVQNYQNALDNERRNYIIQNSSLVGYHLNPYSMSSSQLAKIQRDVEIKNRELLGLNYNMENFY